VKNVVKKNAEKRKETIMTNEMHDQAYTREGFEVLEASRLGWMLTAIIFLAGNVFWFLAWIGSVTQWGAK